MKEATGELNMTVVVVIAVGVLAAFFYTILWPMLRDNYNASSKCSDAICDASTVDSSGMATCKYYKNGSQVGNSFKCAWKG